MDQSAFPGAPPDLAPARLVLNRLEKPLSEFRPLLGARNELGNEPKGGRPPEPAMCPARHARLASAGSSCLDRSQRPSSGSDAKAALAATTTTAPHRGSPAWHYPSDLRPTPPAGPLTTSSAPLASSRGSACHSLPARPPPPPARRPYFI